MKAFELLPSAFVSGEAIIPLTLAKAQCRVLDDDGDDGLIAVFRDAAINLVEQYTCKRLAPTSIEWVGAVAGSDAIVLGAGPVTAVTGIEILDSDGNDVAPPITDIVLGAGGRLRLKDGAFWPAEASVSGAVTVTFIAGYPSGALPPALIQAALFMIGHFYKNREAVATGVVAGEMPMGFIAACAPYRQPVIG